MVVLFFGIRLHIQQVYINPVRMLRGGGTPTIITACLTASVHRTAHSNANEGESNPSNGNGEDGDDDRVLRREAH